MRKLEEQTTHNFWGIKRVLFFLAIICNIIYIGWRLFYTIPFGYAVWEIAIGVLLLIVEIGGIWELLSRFRGMSKSTEPILPAIDEELYPDVDVFVTTCGESIEVLRRTLNGCVRMDYPDKSKVHIYLCDDKQKMKKEIFSDGIAIKGNGKRVKDFSVEELAKYMGVSYLSRAEFKGAKSGNLNNALEQTKLAEKASPIIVTLDADMVPMHDFLMDTIPFFLLNEQAIKNGEEPDYEPVGFVQTPKGFLNPDLFQLKLGLENQIPNEEDDFYRSVQLAKNASNSVVCGGSNIVISRQVLDDVEGFCEEIITEDLTTGMMIEGKGYRCYSVDNIYTLGKATDGMNELLKQRKCRARACVHALRKQKFIWGLKELAFCQKLNYSALFGEWIIPIKRMLYFAVPIVIALYGWNLITYNVQQVLMFWLPTYVVTVLMLRNCSHGIRTMKWTRTYETILFPVLLLPIVKAFFEKIDNQYDMTKKEKVQKSKKGVLSTVAVLSLFVALSVVGMINIVMRIIGSKDLGDIVILFWLIFNLISLIYSISFLMKKELDTWSIRFEAEVPFTLKSDYFNEEFETMMIAEEGFQFTSKQALNLTKEKEYRATFEALAGEKVCHCNLGVRIVADNTLKNKKEPYRYTAYLCEYKESDMDVWLAIVYDRFPVLPMEMNDPVGPFGDIKNVVVKVVD